MRALQVISSAYRCTIEEQDDPAVWITHAMKGQGAELGVVLRGNAVCYAIEGQDASGISFGDWQQTNPPRLDRDIASLVEKGIDVYVVEEDAQERGIASSAFMPGLKPVPRGALVGLFAEYDQIWNW
ncbi:MAG: DsrE family protein [Planctomycetota bacterium]|jgi:sulfur transfer complex TusBCD TusB component (DsrH family)